MSGFEDRYPENMKNFLLSEESKYSNVIIIRQNKIIENISTNQKLDEFSNIEYYNEIPYDNDTFLEKCEEILIGFLWIKIIIKNLKNGEIYYQMIYKIIYYFLYIRNLLIINIK
jgi:hypothetical protein